MQETISSYCKYEGYLPIISQGLPTALLAYIGLVSICWTNLVLYWKRLLLTDSAMLKFSRYFSTSRVPDFFNRDFGTFFWIVSSRICKTVILLMLMILSSTAIQLQQYSKGNVSTWNTRLTVLYWKRCIYSLLLQQ